MAKQQRFAGGGGTLRSDFSNATVRTSRQWSVEESKENGFKLQPPAAAAFSHLRQHLPGSFWRISAAHPLCHLKSGRTIEGEAASEDEVVTTLNI